MVMQPVFRSSSFSSRMSLYAYGTDTPSSSATSLTLIKISPAIGKIPAFPDLLLIASPFYPQDSDRQPFSALCRFLFSLARSRRHKLHIPRPADSDRARSFCCASSSQEVLRLLGNPLCLLPGESIHWTVIQFYGFWILLPHFTTNIFSAFVDYPNCKTSMN